MAVECDEAIAQCKMMLEIGPKYFQAYHLLSLSLHPFPLHFCIDQDPHAVLKLDKNTFIYGMANHLGNSLPHKLFGMPVIRAGSESIRESRCTLGLTVIA